MKISERSCLLEIQFRSRVKNRVEIKFKTKANALFLVYWLE